MASVSVLVNRVVLNVACKAWNGCILNNFLACFIRRQVRVIYCLAIVLPGILGAAPALSSTEPLTLADYHRDVWGAKDGVPAEIISMAQTRDGWLWLSTPNGLFRYDGVKFSEFTPYPGESLRRKRLANIVSQPNGELWIGYSYGGFSVLRNGHLKHYTPDDGGIVGAMYEAESDIDGSIWVASTKGLVRFQHGKWTKIDERQGFPGNRAMAVLLDQYGQLWASSKNHLFLFDRTNQVFRPVGLSGDDLSLIESPDGQLWMAALDKIIQVDMGQHATVIPRPARLTGRGSREGIFDREASFWSVNCLQGLCRIPKNELQGLTEFNPGSLAKKIRPKVATPNSPRTNTILEDREGNIWVATQLGLERYRPNKIRSISLPEESRFYSIAAAGEDELWIVTKPAGGLWYYARGTTTLISKDQTYTRVTRGLDGSILAGGDKYLERRLNNQVERISLPFSDAGLGKTSQAEVGLLVDDGVNIWDNDYSFRLRRLKDGHWTSGIQLGIPTGATNMSADDQGHLWLSYINNKVIDFHDGKIREFGPTEGIDLGTIGFIDARYDTLISGDNGTAVMINGRFHRLTVDSDSSILTLISGVAVTPNGDRWLNGSKGLLHIRYADWQAFIRHPDQRINYELLNSSDGYSGAALIKVAPIAVAEKQTRLWMVSTTGLAYIDTDTLFHNAIAPTVQITDLVTDGEHHLTGNAITLKAGTKSLDIEFTALSLSYPEKLKIKYQLEGVDGEWQTVGARRSAHYTNLEPGPYRFKVIAGNEDGVWNEKGATLDFSIEAFFYQKYWFYTVCTIGFFVMLYLLYLVRLRITMRRITERMTERIEERERIARALHDTFLQSVQALILGFQAVAHRLPPEVSSRPVLGKLLRQADQVLAEGRDQVMNLRVSENATDGMEKALRDLGKTLEENYPVTFTLSSTGSHAQIKPDIQGEIFYIGREALLNAFQHAQGTQVMLYLIYGTDYFSMHVRDNGKGMPQEIREQGKRPGHWGLTGMRERASGMGGELEILNGVTGGSEVVLTIAASIVYVEDKGSSLVSSLISNLTNQLKSLLPGRIK
ncbi:sensor histidine kinase [Undibacterium sp. Ji50W]|uniref:sensor histidine kinase n=1 Tax=Undibacterium sp. Ji50W TaxID=3413041 RepID=UPI003BF06B80